MARFFPLAPLFALAAVLLIAVGLSISVGTPAHAQQDVRPPETSPGAATVPADPADPATLPLTAQPAPSDSDLWRQIRRGQGFTATLPDPNAPVLIQSEGDNWRAVRNGPVSTYGGWIIVIAALAIGLFAVLRGQIKIDSGRSGETVKRFSLVERWSHWFAASLFVLLAVTGLVVLFGRYVIKPWAGAEAFAVIANAALQGHNLFGPLLGVALLILLGVYFKDNVYQRGDFSWALKGALFSKNHPPSWKYNLGEKSWYWLLFFGGIGVVASGVGLLFPAVVGDLQLVQLLHLIHAISALVLITASLGHIYVGVWGVEGALEGMTTGKVDRNWALEHHRWWAEQEGVRPLPDDKEPQQPDVAAGSKGMGGGHAASHPAE